MYRNVSELFENIIVCFLHTGYKVERVKSVDLNEIHVIKTTVESRYLEVDGTIFY